MKSGWWFGAYPSENIKVDWDDYWEYMDKTCSKPPISYRVWNITWRTVGLMKGWKISLVD